MVTRLCVFFSNYVCFFETMYVKNVINYLLTVLYCYAIWKQNEMRSVLATKWEDVVVSAPPHPIQYCLTNTYKVLVLSSVAVLVAPNFKCIQLERGVCVCVWNLKEHCVTLLLLHVQRGKVSLLPSADEYYMRGGIRAVAPVWSCVCVSWDDSLMCCAPSCGCGGSSWSGHSHGHRVEEDGVPVSFSGLFLGTLFKYSVR